MSRWEPQLERTYEDGVLVSQKIKRTPDGEWEDYYPQPEQEPGACIVKGCRNRKGEGLFVGDLCSPCHTFITTGEGKYSQAYRNSQREWQGLVIDEIEASASLGVYAKPLIEFARAIEAKLKEKNCAT